MKLTYVPYEDRKNRVLSNIVFCCPEMSQSVIDNDIVLQSDDKGAGFPFPYITSTNQRLYVRSCLHCGKAVVIELLDEKIDWEE